MIQPQRPGESKPLCVTNRQLFVFCGRFFPSHSSLIQPSRSAYLQVGKGASAARPRSSFKTIHYQLITQVFLVLSLRHCCKLSNEEVAQRFCLHLVEPERGRAALAPFPTCEFAHAPLPSSPESQPEWAFGFGCGPSGAMYYKFGFSAKFLPCPSDKLR